MTTRRLAALGLLAALALLATILVMPARAATPGQIVLLDNAPAFSSVTVNVPGGGAPSISPGRFQLQVTPAGGATTVRDAFCIDTSNPISEGTIYDVSLQTAADDPSLGTPAAGSVAWLIQESDALIAAAADPGFEAGALQVAVWSLLEQVDTTTPTSDAALNARAQALVALSAGKRAAGPVGITAANPSTCAGGAGTTLTVTGTPGATASLAVTSGQGTLSASQVTFSAAGTATVTLSSSSVGNTQVTVTSQGAELTRAARIPDGTQQQEIGFLTPRTFTASVSVGFTNCGSGPGTQPLSPATPTGSVSRPALRVSKVGPARSLSGRTIQYTIVVRNVGKARATGVVARDILPAGLAFARSSISPSSIGERLSWRLGNLAPGASRTLRVWLRAPNDVVGARTNRVAVSASNAATARAAVVTRFRLRPVAVQPAVTG
ncbi:MAG: hypothetical protein AB7L91_16225 [Dehalococcoidia bacterium]